MMGECHHVERHGDETLPHKEGHKAQGPPKIMSCTLIHTSVKPLQVSDRMQSEKSYDQPLNPSLSRASARRTKTQNHKAHTIEPTIVLCFCTRVWAVFGPMPLIVPQ